MLECVVNISEGRRPEVVEAIAGAAGAELLDVHRDPHHHRSVLTLVGEDAARAVAAEAVARLDLTGHDGAHPRFGVVDVVPFVPLAGATMDDACAARDRFAGWAAAALGLPCFSYGPLPGGGARTLPEVRRTAFSTQLMPDTGPARPHPTAGATAVGARPVLVAYNLELAEPDLDLARRLAAGVRGPTIRALGLAVGHRVQVSLNLVEPAATGPADAFDAVATLAARAGARVARGELVGLLPRSVLLAIPSRRWAELGLGEDRTIEAALERAGAG